MKNIKCLQQTSFKAQQGFTLVELIIVIIVLGILALTILPRFTGSSGFAEYALQKQLLGALQNTQLKAMYDTRNNFCYKINLITGTSPTSAFGPSTASYLVGNESNSCGSVVDNSSPYFLRTEAGQISSDGIALTALDNTTPISYVQFDNMGRPFTSAGRCANGCTISFTGESIAKVCIANEGYVHACE